MGAQEGFLESAARVRAALGCAAGAAMTVNLKRKAGDPCMGSFLVYIVHSVSCLRICYPGVPHGKFRENYTPPCKNYRDFCLDMTGALRTPRHMHAGRGHGSFCKGACTFCGFCCERRLDNANSHATQALLTSTCKRASQAALKVGRGASRWQRCCRPVSSFSVVSDKCSRTSY